MPFVKLDTGILHSTLWAEREARELFITALLMAEPHEIHESTKQLKVDNIEPTGFEVPPGWYGFVRAAGIGIIRQAGIERDAGLKALEALGSPDTESRSADYEGRRLVRVDGGYVVLNYMKYRERDITGAERSRRWRAKIKEQSIQRDAVTQRRDDVTSDANVTPTPRRVTQAEVEVEAYSGGKVCRDVKREGLPSPSGARREPSDLAEKSQQQNPPSGLHENNYAVRLMEEISMPNTTQNLRHVAAAIKAEEKARGSLADAYVFILAQAKAEIERKGAVNGFWFQDAKWREKKPEKAKGILAVNGADIKRKAAKRLSESK